MREVNGRADRGPVVAVLNFTKLRLSGFKSFVDATEIPVELGLTGVVGPNGCGKSNLVEALRWAMGETSAKQMRGSEMEDVIFGGSANRPARNVAEVMLSLDNSQRKAPAQFNEFDELEVSRRIERDKGSTYRVNGREVRARDVQLLFADTATGARSPALVSQGRIGQIISQKPAERRLLLEEAAGISGLHSRRHEAELRLRAAESNLERLDDILGTLDTQLQGLKKQARQATRYRNLSDHIRKAEATLYYLRWQAATAALEQSREALTAAEERVNELTRSTATASLEQTRQSTDLPELREAEAKAAAELQRLIIARDNLAEEEARLTREQEETRQRLEQVAHDIEREKGRADDATEAIKRLEAENAEIEEAQAGEADALEEATQRLSEASETVEALDARQTELTGKLAEAEARRSSLERRVQELEDRLQRLTARTEEVERQRAELLAESGEAAELEAATREYQEAEAALGEARAAVERAETARDEAAAALERARAEEEEARSALTRLETEERTLSDLLESGEPEMFPPLIDAVTVATGYEAALGAALGDDLSAPADEPAAVHWRTLSALDDPPALPTGAVPLSDHVHAPPALDRRLSQVGLVPDDETGRRLQGALLQGQRLVSRDGSLWRWDGYTVAADAMTGAARRLEQRNRLQDVRRKIDEARRTLSKTAERTAAARNGVDAAAADHRNARETVEQTERRLATARDRQTTLKEQAAARSSRLASLDETIAGVAADRSDTETALSEARAALAELPDTQVRRGELEEIRTELAEKRAHQADCQSRHAGLARAAEDRARRIADIGRELESWRTRRDDARRQIEQLEARRRELEERGERLRNLPEEIERKRLALSDQVDAAEQTRKAAADKLAERENQVAELGRALRTAESQLADAREARARAEGTVEQHRQSVDGIRERVAEKLDAEPDGLAEIAGIEDGAKLPDLESAERRVERLHRERETMGPVNLRADQEAEELVEQIDTLNSERDDLIQAIDKLRHGIGELNREGRERLLASFREVDQHFRKLFVRLFGGGHAHLTLVESDDPLEAGLEIMASPPGKKMQVLSLLSGGEQALTALAMLFAVFLTNPAPICVLDEVDAPLDDANVDRFCSLLEQIAHNSGTRFIVITHHRMTMARMDRLFGVTMSERGVSQLVSVDIKEAEAMRQTA